MKSLKDKKRDRIGNYRIFLYLALFCSTAALICTCYFTLWKMVPSNIKIKAGVDQTLDLQLPASGNLYKDAIEVSGLTASNIPRDSIHIDLAKPVTLKANEINKYVLDLKLFGIIPLKTVDIQVIQDKTLIPAGIPIGIYVKTEGVLVIGIGEFTGEDGQKYSPSQYILQSGDYITQVNEEKVTSKTAFVDMVKHSEGQEMVLTVKREEEILTLKVRPETNQAGDYKIGVWIRDNAQGVGTMTYLNEGSGFGALGHGINDVDTSTLMNLEEGRLYQTEIVGITRGSNGSPGELTGYIEYDDSKIIGQITENTSEGIFGYCNDQLKAQVPFGELPIGLKQEIKKGPAQIICSIEGEPKYYDIEILEVHLNNDNINRGIVLRITDQELLSLTGGIIQGMSGSPIVQNGKIIGAVTHVLVQDATSGYGIFIENMLLH
ncbi:stage IV sporulation protein B [Kineothrix alysoides]|uniref:Stage IV sporulation protein B n=1 Tax=Kineothrix alysoides TaxID=1469948 RepID=A0A4R1QZF1_9FIRM|nr:SpoIVB peptidase [Kineothrix alysoides]TCL58372.1 stage IV sporulation protein B [Kineothrix alysoides]